MTKKIVLAGLALTLLAVGCYAQDASRVDVSLGYSYLRFNSSNGVSALNTNGGDASASYALTNALHVVGDFGITRAAPNGIGFTTWTYMGGPRFYFHLFHIRKFKPFAEGLVGAAHVSASLSGVSSAVNPFAFGFGGGVDVALFGRGRIALRPQFDYLGLRSNGDTTYAERASASIVFRIGKK